MNGVAYQAPTRQAYDVVIVGGAMLGSSVAWFLASDPDFDGRILVVERDPTYEACSSTHTNSCIRQQFSEAVNVQVSQFGADYILNFRDRMGGGDRVPQPRLHSFGYMYLASTPAAAAGLAEAQKVQAACGAGTRHLTRDQIAEDYPFYHLDDILAANHNTVNEGYFDGATIFDWWKRLAKERGVEYVANEVVGMASGAGASRIETVTLATGEVIGVGTVVNASGPRAARTAQMAGIALPVEPRKRYTYVFEAERPLPRDLPLTIDPSGIHFRTDGRLYMAGCTPDPDPVPDFDDFEMDHDLWEDRVWPAIAHRIPQFDALRVVNSWAGHYAYNTLDQNAVLGPHDEVSNFMFANGFSGHGFQQSPAMGRGLAELIVHGEFRTLDLSAFGYGRIRRNEPFRERAVI